MLVDDKILTRLELAAAMQAQKSTSVRLGRLLVERGQATEADIARCLARQMGLELSDPGRLNPDPAALQLLSFEESWRLAAIAYAVDEMNVYMVVADPLDIETTDRISLATSKKVKLCVASEPVLREQIEIWHGKRNEPGHRADPKAPTRYSHVVRRGINGHGTWFAATDTFLDREVTLTATKAKSDRLLFHIEAIRWAAKIKHPIVTTIYDSRFHRSRQWTAMAAVPGDSIAQASRRGSQRWGIEVLRVLAEFADLIAEHPCGHLSPENVFIRNGEVHYAPVHAPTPKDDITAFVDLTSVVAESAGRDRQRVLSTCHEIARRNTLTEVASVLRLTDRVNRIGDTDEEKLILLQQEEPLKEANVVGALRRFLGRAA
jgi:hypothetical protein